MAIRHISDETNGAPITDTDEFAFDRISTTPDSTWKATAAQLKAYISLAGAVSSVNGTSGRITASPTTGDVIVDIDTKYVGQTSITTLGTIGTGVWEGTPVGGAHGGTGVNNSGKTITIGGSLTTSGAFASTFTMTGVTTVTFPTSGTLVTLSSSPTFVNLTVTGTLSVTGQTNIGGSATSTAHTTLKTSSSFYNILNVGGAITGVSGATEQYGILLNPSFTPVNNGFTSSLKIIPTLVANVGKSISHYGIWLTNDYTGNAGSLATRMLFIDAGGSSVGTVDQCYGAYILSPVAGSSINVALYAANASIGYAAANPPLNGMIISGAFGVGTAGPLNMMDVNGAAVIGSYAGSAAAPTNGLLVSGQVAFGTSSAVSNTALTVSGALTNAFKVVGTLATASVNPIGIWIANTYTPSAAQQAFGLVYQPTFTSPAGNLGAVCGIYGGLTLNGSGTITNVYGIRNDAMVLSGASVTNAYGGSFVDPGVGTNRCALYSDNLSIGYTGVTPPTNGAIISGQLGIGTSSPDAGSKVTLSVTAQLISLYMTGITTLTTGNNVGIYIDKTFSFTSGNANSQIGISISSTFKTTSGTLSGTMACLLTNPQVSGNAGTISNLYGIYCLGGSASAGTITNAYGGYFQNPIFGTNKAAIYSDNIAIGYTATTPPTNGAIISGQVILGASSVSAFAATDPFVVYSSTSSRNITAVNTFTYGGSAGAGLYLFADASTPVTSGARLGFLIIGGVTDSSHTTFNATNIAAFAEENWSGTAGGAALTFATTAPTTVSRTEKMRLTGSGKLGIGMNNPIGNCQVLTSGTQGIWGTNSDFVNGSAGSGYYLHLGADTGSTYTQFQAFTTGNSAAGNMVLNRFGGNIGIGLTSISAKLEVFGGTLATTLNAQVEIARFSLIDNSADGFRFYANRNTAAGTAWDTTDIYIQRRVDATDMGYIKFGGINVAAEYIKFGFDTTDNLSILKTGSVTNTLQPAFLAYLSSTAVDVTGDGTNYDVVFNSEVFDQQANFNTSTGVFTAPVTGRYQFNASIYLLGLTASHTQATVYLRTSNRDYITLFNGANIRDSSNQAFIPIAMLCDMDASDTAYIRVTVSNGTKVVDIPGGSTSASFFSGNLVC